MVYVTHRRTNTLQLHLDGQVLYSGGYGHVVKVVFTPDSRHLFWVLGPKTNRSPRTLYLDSKPILQLQNHSPFSNLRQTPSAWHMGKDGALQFLTEENGESVRYRVSVK